MLFSISEFLWPLLSLIVSLVVYPFVLRIAIKHNIVDNPNARKLQRVPVPVMGGFVVFSGIIVALLVSNTQLNDTSTWVGLTAMTTMLVIGAWDDIMDVSATLRFILEMALVYGMVVLADIGIDSFHGLWGIGAIPDSVSLPLSVIVGVGVINATNLIDGVDGYSSGFGILSCALFAALFYEGGNVVMGRLALICVGALIPFFLHNVFGNKSKMFIGDSGSLMMGAVLSLFVFSFLSKDGSCAVLEDKKMGMLPFSIAVLSIPVFDTLRVMCVRIIRGKSPFHPDKTHLHHLFIEMGFSHLGTTFFILSINVFIVAAWFVSWKLGASVDVQFYVVVALSFLATFGFYKLMKVQQNKGDADEDGYPTGGRLWKWMCNLGEKTHIERNGFWQFMRNLVDGGTGKGTDG